MSPNKKPVFSVQFSRWTGWALAIAMLCMLAPARVAMAHKPKKKLKTQTTVAGSVVPGKLPVIITVKGAGKPVRANRKSGFFSLSNPGLAGTHTVDLRQGKKTYSLSVTVPMGGRVDLSGVTLNSDGTVSLEQEDETVNGTLSSVACSVTPTTATIAAETGPVTLSFDVTTTKIVDVSSGTVITSCSNLDSYAGQTPAVPVKAETIVGANGSLSATEIDLNPQSPSEGGGGSSVDFHGSVTANNCPASISVSRSSDSTDVTVDLNPSTQISIDSQDNQTAGTCADLVVNAQVEVEGSSNPDGSVTAATVTLDQNKFDQSGTIDTLNCSSTPLPSLTFTPTGAATAVTVTIGPTTQIEANDSNTATCANLALGVAQVEGQLQPDGSVAASSIGQSSSQSGGGDN
ncbi:MAG: DUF5666 domain-containing protein [Candidatus Binataceae bacterium]